MPELRPTSPQNRLRPTPTTTLMEVLRAHGLRELKHQDEATLRRYAAFLKERITAHEHTLRTNLQRGFAVEIRADIRYFLSIQDEISSLLTATFNGI